MKAYFWGNEQCVIPLARTANNLSYYLRLYCSDGKWTASGVEIYELGLGLQEKELFEGDFHSVPVDVLETYKAWKAKVREWANDT